MNDDQAQSVGQARKAALIARIQDPDDQARRDHAESLQLLDDLDALVRAEMAALLASTATPRPPRLRLAWWGWLHRR